MCDWIKIRDFDYDPKYEEDSFWVAHGESHVDLCTYREGTFYYFDSYREFMYPSEIRAIRKLKVPKHPKIKKEELLNLHEENKKVKMKKMSEVTEGECFTIGCEFYYQFKHPVIKFPRARFDINLMYNCEFQVRWVNHNTAMCALWIEGFYCEEILILWNNKHEPWIKDFVVSILK